MTVDATVGLDESTLTTLRAHADWVQQVTAATEPHRGRVLSHAELDSWGRALRSLLDEVTRLRQGTPCSCNATSNGNGNGKRAKK